MKRKALQLIVFLGFALMATLAAAASPSVDDIYQAARAGHLGDAQRMVDQVVAEHPKSAKAHYVAAEIYAKEGKTATARNELQTAEQLEPGLPFAKPQSVAELKSLLAAPAAAAGQSPAGQSAAGQGSFPWGTVVILLLAVGVIVMVVKSLAARNAAPQNYYPGGGAPGQGYGPGYGPAGGYPGAGGGGLGSSIVGGLATGAAVGAGMVAGEALAHHFLDGDQPHVAAQDAPQNAAYVQNSDMGGNDFGINDASSWDDNTNYADLSSGDVGGDDWS